MITTTRSPRGARGAAAVVALAILAVATACADKGFNPTYKPSPVIRLQLVATGLPTANQVGAPNAVVTAVVYFHDLRFTGDSGNNNSSPDSLGFLYYQAHHLTGSSTSVTASVDLSPCLQDPTRHGSKDGCDIYVAIVLGDYAQLADSSRNTSLDAVAYDFQVRGPFTVTPGHPPAIPSVDLQTSHYAVHQFVADEALRVGGPGTPVEFDGAITGFDNGSSVTLYGVTNGSTTLADQSQNYGGPQLAVFQNGAWTRFQYPRAISTPGGGWGSAAALAANDVYLIGQDGLYHFDGTSISAVSAVRGEPITTVGAVSGGTTRTVLAGTANGGVWVGNGTTFQRYAALQGATVDMVCATGPTEAFATNSSGGIARFDGATWTSVPVPGAAGTKSDLTCLSSPGQAYVNTGQQSSPLYKWNGSSWTAVPITGLQTVRSWNFGVSSATEMWAVGDSGGINRVYARFNGTSWSEVGRSQARQFSLRRPWASPRGGAFFAMSNVTSVVGLGTSARIDQVTPTGISVVSYQPSLRDVIVPTATSAFVVGEAMFLARWNGTRWTVDPPPAGLNALRTLYGVWSDGPNNAWVVGQQSTILRWNGTTWTSVSSALLPVVSPVDNYRAAWGTGSTVWIAGDASLVRCTGTVCTPVSAPGSGVLYSIWGLSATNVYAVGAGGRIVHFDGTSWAQVSSGTNITLFRIWGSGPADIYAAGEGVLLHFGGTSWQRLPLTRGLEGLKPVVFQGQNQPSSISFNIGMWGAGPSDIYIGTLRGQVVRNNGFEWNALNESFYDFGRLTGISGVRGGCVLVVNDGFPSNGQTNLQRGVGPNGECGSAMGRPLSWP